MQNKAKVSTFQERFAELFSETNKTTRELAKELHVSNQTVSAWKTGTRSPKEPTVIAIAQHFGVSEMWLLGYDVKKEAQEHPQLVGDPSLDLEVVAARSRIPPPGMVVPDSSLFGRMIGVMTPEEIATVTNIFSKAFQKLSKEGEEKS